MEDDIKIEFLSVLQPQLRVSRVNAITLRVYTLSLMVNTLGKLLNTLDINHGIRCGCTQLCNLEYLSVSPDTMGETILEESWVELCL